MRVLSQEILLSRELIITDLLCNWFDKWEKNGRVAWGHDCVSGKFNSSRV